MSLPDEQPPKFWKTWRRFYAIQLVYWIVLLVLMIIGTRVLNQ
jgi:hypothetical protein